MFEAAVEKYRNAGFIRSVTFDNKLNELVEKYETPPCSPTLYRRTEVYSGFLNQGGKRPKTIYLTKNNQAWYLDPALNIALYLKYTVIGAQGERRSDLEEQINRGANYTVEIVAKDGIQFHLVEKKFSNNAREIMRQNKLDPKLAAYGLAVMAESLKMHDLARVKHLIRDEDGVICETKAYDGGGNIVFEKISDRVDYFTLKEEDVAKLFEIPRGYERRVADNPKLLADLVAAGVKRSREKNKSSSD